MGFGSVAMQMVVVSLPVLVGWAANKLGLMDDAFDVKLSALVLNVGLPCMILSSLNDAPDLPGLPVILLVMLAGLVMYLVSLAVAYGLSALMRAPLGTRAAYRFAVAFGNCGFIGFPVITALFGDGALLYAALGLIPANFMMYSVGVLMFANEKNALAGDATRTGGMRRQLRGVLACLKTPTLVASVVVLVLVLAGVTDLGVVGESLGIVGDMTTPVALLLMGSSIAKYEPLSMLGNWRAYLAAAARLLVAPLVGFALVRLLPLDGYLLGIAVIECAMPVATNGTLYCLQYGADTQPMMQTTFISLVASVLTIPLVAMLM